MAFLVKLLVIYIGSGLVSLLAFWIAKEVSLIPQLILQLEKEKKLKIKNQNKISSETALYKVIFNSNKSVKLFSSHKGMKTLY